MSNKGICKNPSCNNSLNSWPHHTEDVCPPCLTSARLAKTHESERIDADVGRLYQRMLGVISVEDIKRYSGLIKYLDKCIKDGWRISLEHATAYTKDGAVVVCADDFDKWLESGETPPFV